MVYNKQIAIRLPPKDVEAIEQCVNEGYASNQSDFVRLAVREKIAECRRFEAYAEKLMGATA